jgi:hypothetical protein
MSEHNFRIAGMTEPMLINRSREDAAHNPPMQRTGAAGIVLCIRKGDITNE